MRGGPAALCDDTFPCWRSRLGKARDLASAAYAQANLNDHVRRPRGHDDEPIAFGDAPAFPLEVLPPWLGVWAAQQVHAVQAPAALPGVRILRADRRRRPSPRRRDGGGRTTKPRTSGAARNRPPPSRRRAPLARPRRADRRFDETYRQGKTNVVEKRYRAETITKVRGVMHRLFRSAEEEDQIERNPLTAVRCPRTREIKKERSILTDDEFERFIGCAEIDLELRMLSLVARCEGGMRTGDLHHWDWTMIDRDGFEQCTIPRSKTRTPQPLEIPGVLRPFVRAWWQSAGGPEAGPVFPVRRGGPRGAAEAPEQRLRQAPAAGSVSGGRGPHAPDRRARDPTGHAHRSRTVRRGDATRFDTATTLPVDFHSFRRAFNTALAESGVNLQRAMHVAGHADAKTHMRYVMRGSGMRSIPAEALPQIAASAGSIVTDCDDWTAGKMKSSMISARPAGLEPATRGLEEGSQRTTM
jgi:integrase